MLHFLPAHINCLESQVDAYAAAETVNRVDVEELMSIFLSLATEIEKSLAKEHLAGSGPHAPTADFKRLATIGGRIRGMATHLRKEGHIVAGIDPFVRSVIRCRDIAHQEEIAADPAHADRAESTQRLGANATNGNS